MKRIAPVAFFVAATCWFAGAIIGEQRLIYLMVGLVNLAAGMILTIRRSRSTAPALQDSTPAGNSPLE